VSDLYESHQKLWEKPRFSVESCGLKLDYQSFIMSLTITLKNLENAPGITGKQKEKQYYHIQHEKATRRN